MKWLCAVMPVAAVAVSGCIATPCTLIALPGIRVTIVDAATGSPVTGDLVVVATEGSYTEFGDPRGRPVILAVERPGTYRVEVQAPGSVPWVKPEVRVTKDECHVRPADLTAELLKSGGS